MLDTRGRLDSNRATGSGGNDQEPRTQLHALPGLGVVCPRWPGLVRKDDGVVVTVRHARSSRMLRSHDIRCCARGKNEESTRDEQRLDWPTNVHVHPRLALCASVNSRHVDSSGDWDSSVR